MTAQINDSVFHRKIKYSIAGVSGAGLFEPRQHGLEPVAMSSACWRGYFCDYVIRDDRLLLSRVSIAFSSADATYARAGKGPQLFGKPPVQPIEQWARWAWCYDDLSQPVPFSGGVLLGDGFIRKLYVHMGFHPAWKYRDVREVIFEQGRLTDDFDRSEQMKDVRGKRLEHPIQPGSNARTDEIRRWVDKCFTLDYNK